MGGTNFVSFSEVEMETDSKKTFSKKTSRPFWGRLALLGEEYDKGGSL